jgi:hypothetical protein
MSHRTRQIIAYALAPIAVIVYEGFSHVLGTQGIADLAVLIGCGFLFGVIALIIGEGPLEWQPGKSPSERRARRRAARRQAAGIHR